MEFSAIFFQLIHLIRRELLLSLRHRGALAMNCGFYLLLAGLVPFVSNADKAATASLGGGLLWLFFLLTLCLSLERLAVADRRDGSLAQILLSGTPPFLLAIAKSAGLWISCALPLLILTPLAAMLLDLGGGVEQALLLALLCGSPGLCLTATLAASLTAAARPQAALLPLLLLPLYVPALILGGTASYYAAHGLAYGAPLLWLLALSLSALALFPPLAGFALKGAA